MTNLLRVFVYGTLKPGECNYDRYCAGRVVEVQAAIVYGQLFDLPLGYPAMTPGTLPVYGVLLSFVDPAILRELDDLEDYDPHRPTDANEYVRVQTQVFSLNGELLGSAWVYQMEQEQAKRLGGVFLPNGIWTGRRKE